MTVFCLPSWRIASHQARSAQPNTVLAVSYRLPPLGPLRAFESACRHLSFKKAAEELSVTPAAVSQQIKVLESYLGFKLFRRLARALEVTPEGLAMLPKIHEAFECLATAVERTRHTGDGPLIVDAPPSFASHWLIPRLARFTDTNPDVEVHLSSSSHSVDGPDGSRLAGLGLFDPREAPTAVAIRYGAGSYPGMHVEQLFAPVYVPVCSVNLPTAQRPLGSLADLRRHTLIHDDTLGDERHEAGWKQWLAAAGVTGVDAMRGPRFANAALALEAALAGQGVTLALRPVVELEVAAGRLMIPFEIAVRSPYAYFFVTPESIAQRWPVIAFRRWLLAECARH